ADAKVTEIWDRGNLPILVGGTGLYLRVFEYGLFKVDVKAGLRAELQKRAKEDLQSLYQELEKLDPQYAKKIHPHDKVRIIRALEVIYSTGMPFSYFHKKTPFFSCKRYPILKIGLYLPKEELYAKIKARVEKMIEAGWLEEVRNLKEKFGEEIFDKIKAIGYKELAEVLKGRLNFESAIKIIQRKSKLYAKRQLTWFRKDKDIEWFQPKDKEKIEERIRKFLN
ncbi:MAG: tRNA (adenosine(37)-N6)-dimethylallyltransferase MiaA, partial [Caldimicrobium sp.]